jgi:hypothetical protein
MNLNESEIELIEFIRNAVELDRETAKQIQGILKECCTRGAADRVRFGPRFPRLSKLISKRS